MQVYQLKLLTESGSTKTKIIEMEDGADVAAYISGFGANVVSVRQLPEYFRYLKLKKKITAQEIIEVLDNLHMIVRSGLPITTGITDMAADEPNPALADVLGEVAYRITTGMTLSKAMTRFESVFTGMVVNLVRIGEETGRLDETLKNAADHMRRMSDLKTKTKSALIYPSFAFAGMMGAMTFWMVVVMPKMIEAFKSFNIVLPPTTRFIMWLSSFMQSYFIEITLFMIGAVVLHFVMRKKNIEYRYQTDRVATKLPVFGVIIKNYNFAFIAEYIKLMITAGLPLYTALGIMEDSLGNLVYSRSMSGARELIATGSSFSAALAQQKLYPKVITRMVSVGEQTGNLDDQLGNVASYYYYKVNTIATNISKMIEPIVIGVVGVFMLVIMLGLLGPIFTLISSMPT